MNDLLLAPLQWSTEKRKVKDLIPYEYNPRKLSEEKKQKLRESLEKYNLAEIPAVNTNDVIIAGHQRIVVLMEIGRGEEIIDVRVPNRELTELEFKEYNIRSNVQVGDWDLDILTAIFDDVDLLSIGLNVDDIPLPELMLPSELISEEEAEFDPEPPKVPISVLGDIYEMRSLQKKLVHRVICGDSREPDVYQKLLGGLFFNMVLTDPPYNVNYTGGTKDKLQIENDNMSSADFYTFLFEFYKATCDHSNPGAGIYVFHADSEGANFRNALKDAGFKLAQCLIWLKNGIVMGRQDYQWKHEPCLYGWKEGAAHNWYSDRKQTTILEFNKPLKSEDHPTMKPVEMFTYLIKNSTKQFEIVGDSFLGSGTTLISCEMTWRQCRGIELDPRFVDVAVKRWVKYMRDNHLDFELCKNGHILSKSEIDLFFE
ncbi:DNA modification methylase [Flavobacterium sp. T12S277]|uniref:DNA modification methylase n=1 Tax=Flavobacterium sp. T12S277 TaxID=3402752 RepID=UPI003ADCDF7B